MKTISIIVLLSIIINIVKADFFSDFWKPVFTNAPKFQSSQLYLINDIGFNGYDGIVMAFGDFNADKYLDTFFLYSNKTTLQVFLWNVESWKYEASDIIIQMPENNPINNVVAGDFTYDGTLDILVQYTDTNTLVGDNDDKVKLQLQQDKNKEVGEGEKEKDVIVGNGLNYMNLYKGSYTAVELPVVIDSADSPTDQVLVLDANGDLHLDMFGVNVNGERTLWINNDGSYYSMPAPTTNGPNGPLGPLSKPHSNSFIDLNGDCLADLFITSVDQNDPSGETIIGEIWANNKLDGYSFITSLTFPIGTGQITFADFDNDGDLDMIYPVYKVYNDSYTVNEIYIVSNIQKPVCASSLFSNPSVCRPQDALCTVDNFFRFSNTTVEDGYTIIIPSNRFNGSIFYSDIVNGVPLIIHSGDYNIDGYPDILISLIDPNNMEAGPHVELWENVGCDSSICSGSTTGGRTFLKAIDGTDALMAIPNAYSAVFVDFGENGIADILVWSGMPGLNGSMTAVFNNFYNDAFFFKTLGLNGVCTTMCPTGKKFPDPKPYGVNFPGSTFKFTYTDLSGHTHIQIGAQLYASSYMSLQTPYNLFGLGRTSNYVDQLFFGMPLNQSVHFNNWVGTIPNSQVVAIPYKPDNPTGWTLELYINPSGIFFWVLIAFFAALILLSAICFVLYKREKQEDIKMKQDQPQFYFNAL